MPEFRVFGHRGAAGYEPENTLRAVRKALQLGVEWIEIDVYAVEGELVVFHDFRLNRTTNGKGLLEEASLEYLRSLDAGKGEKIPFLREVLDLIDGRMGVNIELKGERTASLVAKVVQHYLQKPNWTPERFLVSSFNHSELAAFKSMLPSVNIGGLICHIPLDLARFAEELDAYSIHASLEFLSEEFIKDAHRRGFKFFVYTVNHVDDATRLRAIGADGIYSDYPDLLDSL